MILQLNAAGKFKRASRHGIETKNFWNPDFDTFYDTLLKPELDKITLTKEGQVKMRNINKQINIKCVMNYKWYPFDTQICKHYIIIGSWHRQIR